MKAHWIRVATVFLFAVLVTGVPSRSSRADAPTPEIATGVAAKPPSFAPHDMVAAANPLAAQAGREILRRGGNAVDAAVAMQMVLNLVEPQSSGLGGGAFLVYWSAKDRHVTSFDGRETAPAAAKPDRFLDANGQPLAFFDAVVGGKSVGVPGALRMLELAHRQYGKLPWAQLFQPAIDLAEKGFPISPRLYEELAADRFLAQHEPARSYFYQADGTPKPAGTLLTNPVLAATFRAIAAGGADVFYRGKIAQDIAATVAGAAQNPGDLTAADIANYKPLEREAVCGTYRHYRICGMGPPSSGGVTVLEQLGMLDHFDLSAQKNTLAAWHLFAEASQLAYADRDRYVGDPAFVEMPVKGLLDPTYLEARAKLIDPAHAAQGKVAPGDPPGQHADEHGDNLAPEFPSTSNIAIVDSAGDALDMTTSIENAFGSRLMVDGFLLNNELTDFSFVPEEDGKPVANRVEAGKRPRSAMSPTLVFAPDGHLFLALGSAGGPAIITDVSKTLVAILDWQMDIAAALALPNIGNRNGPTEVESGANADALAQGLTVLGHNVKRSGRPSGLSGIAVTPRGLEGAADPRREGAAFGD